ncbi:Lcl domain-containing protein, partial [Vibrio cholerae]
TPANSYWSSSPNAYYSNYAWDVGFGYGYVGYDDKNYYDFHVRLVRAGQ